MLLLALLSTCFFEVFYYVIEVRTNNIRSEFDNFQSGKKPESRVFKFLAVPYDWNNNRRQKNVCKTLNVESKSRRRVLMMFKASRRVRHAI